MRTIAKKKWERKTEKTKKAVGVVDFLLPLPLSPSSSRCGGVEDDVVFFTEPGGRRFFFAASDLGMGIALITNAPSLRSSLSFSFSFSLSVRVCVC